MIVELKNLKKSFYQGPQVVDVFQELNLSLNEGETLAVLGPSGSGKSTLLSLMAGLDAPTSGEIWIDGQNLSLLNEKELTFFRAKKIGIIFQQFHLFSHLTAVENVALPLELAGHPEAEEKARYTLDLVGLSHRAQHFPYQMSGGENQRVAIARAFIVKPRLLLADEPSGSLDTRTGDQIMNLLFDLVSKEKTTMVLVTHNEDLALRCQRQFRLGI